jgi:hypothetical protein
VTELSFTAARRPASSFTETEAAYYRELLVHFSAQREHCLWDILDGFSNNNGSDSGEQWRTIDSPCRATVPP